MLILILIVAIVLAIFIVKNTKYIKFGTLTLFNGGVKTGKTSLAVHCALRNYRISIVKWWLRNFFKSKHRRDEKPLLYSNIPLKCKYVPLTTELLERKERFSYKSTILISEVSLIADSMAYKNEELNEDLLLFFKLIGHETKGGAVFVDTQCISDCHYSLKRTLNSYIYIDKTIKWIPFILLMKVREERYSEDKNSVNVYNEDVQKTANKLVLISKRAWKYFDCYCYSCLTDDLAKADNFVDNSNNSYLKAEKIITFKNSIIKKVGKQTLKIKNLETGEIYVEE